MPVVFAGDSPPSQLSLAPAQPLGCSSGHAAAPWGHLLEHPLSGLPVITSAQGHSLTRPGSWGGLLGYKSSFGP